MKEIIRISTYNPKLANKNKIDTYECMNKFLLPYLNKAVKILNEEIKKTNKKPKVFSDKCFTDQLNLPSKLSQVIFKAASSNLRSIYEKKEKAKWCSKKINVKLKKYQKELLNKTNIIPIIKTYNIELDSRFILITKSNTDFCDYWIKFRGFEIPSKNKTRTYFIPLKLTNHMKKLIQKGFKLKTKCLRINNNGDLGLYFKKEINTSSNKRELKGVGVDIGMNDCIATSDKKLETTHIAGLKIIDILNKLNSVKKRRKLSKSPNRNWKNKSGKKGREFLKNQINYSIRHDIDWTTLDFVCIEDIKNIKKRGFNKKNWRASYILQRIQDIADEKNVFVQKVNPAYTSQVCSNHQKTLWIDKNCVTKSDITSHRKHQDLFICNACGFEDHAGFNASKNIFLKATALIHNKGVNSPLGSKKLIHKLSYKGNIS